MNHTREMDLDFLVELWKHQLIDFDISYNNSNNEETSIIIGCLSDKSQIIDINISNKLLDHNTAKTIFENFKDYKKLKKINIRDK